MDDLADGRNCTGERSGLVGGAKSFADNKMDIMATLRRRIGRVHGGRETIRLKRDEPTRVSLNLDL
jgi:hypothetical protein